MTSALKRGSAKVPFSTVTTMSPGAKLPSLVADSVKGPELVDIVVSQKSIATLPVVVRSSVAPVTLACAMVMVTSTSSALVWFVALPVKATVI